MEEITIKNAAKKLGVEAHVLRYWEDELGLEIKRNSLGHRYYDDRDIKMFNEVKELKARGLSLKDIRLGIAKHKKLTETKEEVLESDGKTEESIKEKIKENIEDNIEDKIENKIEGKTAGEDALHERGALQDDDIKIVDFKQAQLQAVMNRIVANALRENKDIITTSVKEEITGDVMRQFDAVMREKEEREEERFRKLDECLRQIQRANDEAAATKVRRRFGRKK